jgi:hypothetical protein
MTGRDGSDGDDQYSQGPLTVSVQSSMNFPHCSLTHSGACPTPNILSVLVCLIEGQGQSVGVCGWRSIKDTVRVLFSCF